MANVRSIVHHNEYLIPIIECWFVASAYENKKNKTKHNHTRALNIYISIRERELLFWRLRDILFQMLYSNKMRAYAYDYTYGSVWTISPFPIVNICGKTIEFKCTFSWWFSMQKLLRRCVKCTLRIYRDEIQFNRWIWDRIENRFYIHRIYSFNRSCISELCICFICRWSWLIIQLQQLLFICLLSPSYRFDSKSEKRLEYDTARDHSQLARCIKLRESAHNYIWIVLFLSSTISWILEFDLYSGFDRKIKQQPKQKQ